MPISRQDCVDLDQGDPLAGRREFFELPEGLIYLDGNSLGALPRAVKTRLKEVVENQWGRDLIGSWNTHAWIELPARVGRRIARLVGAEADEVVAADSTSVNLFKLAAAAVRMRPGRRVVVTERGDFPTDGYILQGLADFLGGSIELRAVDGGRARDALDQEVALLLLSHVHFRSGLVQDMAALTRRAHEVGALTLWDLSHSAGALDVQLNRDHADFAVGCGYKYLNGGPGAPAFLFAARRLQDELRTPLSGWMGHAAPFAFEEDYRPAPGVLRGLCGTPPILSLAALDEALDAFDGVEMADIRRKSERLTSLFLRLVQERCAGTGLEAACPADAAIRGSQASLRHPEGYAIVQALIAAGVVGDFRSPDLLRFGFAPLYVRHVDVWDAVDRLAEVMARELWRAPEHQVRRTVT